jgi:hypothetical protein
MKSLSVKTLLSLVDTSVLNEAAEATQVDYQAKKLKGEIVLKLLLMSLLDSNKMSLRVMENLYKSNKFKLFAGLKGNASIAFSSLSERLSNINADFFEQIFHQTFTALKSKLGKDGDKYLIRIFDSTVISASAKLLKQGMVNGLKNKEDKHTSRQVKFTVGLYKNIPSVSLLFTEQKHLAEDETLKTAILQQSFADNEIAVFDRGIKARKTYQEFKQKNVCFVTRINPTKSISVIKDNPLPKQKKSATLLIKTDQQVHLFYEAKMKLKETFRLIKAESLETKEPLFFLTNIDEMPAVTVTDIYKQRWEIEVFFKFLKQHLHLKHFFSYSENGIKVMMYVSMIAAILLLIYKKENSIQGYKIAKIQFTEELDMEIIKEIVIICGGDPSKSSLFNSS